MFQEGEAALGAEAVVECRGPVEVGEAQAAPAAQEAEHVGRFGVVGEGDLGADEVDWRRASPVRGLAMLTWFLLKLYEDGLETDRLAG